MKNFKDFGIKPAFNHFTGDKIKVDRVLNREIVILKYKVDNSTKKPGTKCLCLQIELEGERRIIFTGSTILLDMIRQVPESEFPFKTTIVSENNHLEFT